MKTRTMGIIIISTMLLIILISKYFQYNNFYFCDKEEDLVQECGAQARFIFCEFKK